MFINGNASAGAELVTNAFTFPVAMRATPVDTIAGTWFVTNSGQPTASNITAKGLTLYSAATASGLVRCHVNTTDDYLELDAEL